jgi:hypothetical protein
MGKTNRKAGEFHRQSKVFGAAKLLFSIAFIALFFAAPMTSLLAAPQQSQDPLVVIANMQVARKGHTATWLQDGRVLIAGGENDSGPVAEMELFNPAQGLSSLGPNARMARADHAAVLLVDGRVLITGGRAGNQRLNSTEIFNPATNSLNDGPFLNHERAGHVGVLLSDGRYLLIGGDDFGTAEIFDPVTRSFELLSAHLGTPRFSHSAALLKNGKVLVAGGMNPNGQRLSTAELFDPATMTFSPVSNAMHSSRTNPALRVLPDGKVQIIGGDDEGTMEMYNASGNYFAAYAHLVTGAEAIGKLLRSPGRKAMLNLNSQSSGVQSAVSRLSSDVSSVITEVAERAAYSLTPLPQSNKVVLAGGATNSSAATGSAFLISSSGNAAITTDKTDYHPGETVVISGSGFQPGETVDFLMHVEPLTSPDTVLTPSVADANGNFVNTTFVVRRSDANVTLTLTATGESSGLIAQTIFTDIFITSITVTKVVDWNGTTPDPGKTFQICVQGPSYPTPDCQDFGYLGDTLSWYPDLDGTYTVTETDPGLSWTVSGSPSTVEVVGGNDAAATITNTIKSAPVTSSCLNIHTIQGVAITPIQMPAGGGAGGPYTFSATGLPAGLSMSANGIISGTPTVSGSFDYAVTIMDGAGNQGIFNCSVAVFAPITSSCLSITAIQGAAIIPVQVTASGGSGGYTFSATGLPDGLTMDVNGIISGTPTVNGTFNYTVAITDSLGHQSGFGCSLTVYAPITSSCVNINAIQGTAIAPAQMPVNGGAGGPYLFSVTGLPAGLSMAADGTISGTPTVHGTFNYTVNIADSAGNQGTFTCSIMVYAPITSSCVSISAMEGMPITPVQITANGGAGGYVFSATGLPDGLSMDANGTIAGTPNVSGTFDYTVTITDSANNQGRITCSIIVYTPIASSCMSINAIEGMAIVPAQMPASGGAGGPYTFSASDLPAGLTMAADGTISGTPTVNGAFIYTAIITDGIGNQGTFTCSIVVHAPIRSGCVGINAIQGTAIAPVKMTATGGAGEPYTFSAAGLPAGLIMNADGTISGTPTESGDFNYTVTIIDSANNSGTFTCSVTVYTPITSSCLSIDAILGVEIIPARMVAGGGAGGPYIFSAAGLPDGLTMTSDGTISGIPMVTGSYNYTVIITDNANNQGSSSCSIKIAEPQHPHLTLAKTANPTTYGTANQLITYNYLLTNSGDATLSGPFMISDDKLGSFQCGNTTTLIPGASTACTANHNITKEDLIEGSVTNVAYGHAHFGNSSIDSNQAIATVVANIPNLTLSCAGGFAPVGKPYTFSLPASGGVLPYSFSITSGALPPGLTLNAATGAITGTPIISGEFTFTAQVVDYRGNSAGTAAASCGAILTYQESQFVIWGGNPVIPAGRPANVTIGQDYVFWGAQWWKQVLGGNWTANASFKGYANQVDRANGSWTTRPGNSSGPPDSVGRYISVIIATQATKQGSEISGNIAEIGILRVDDPGAYQPNPGHAGSGVLIAIVR